MGFIYVVGYSVGSYEDFRDINVFATLNEEVANAWKTKAENMVNKWRDYYESSETFSGNIWSDFKYFLKDINYVYIEKMEIR